MKLAPPVRCREDAMRRATSWPMSKDDRERHRLRVAWAVFWREAGVEPFMVRILNRMIP